MLWPEAGLARPAFPDPVVGPLCVVRVFQRVVPGWSPKADKLSLA